MTEYIITRQSLWFYNHFLFTKFLGIVGLMVKVGWSDSCSKLIISSQVDADDAEEEALGGSAGAISGAGVQNMIEKALDRFAADRVGMPDYALESSGIDYC